MDASEKRETTMSVGASRDSFGSRGELRVGASSYEIFRLSAVAGAARLPFSLKVLLENLLRTEDGANVTADQIRALGQWDPTAEPDTEIQFSPARVIMQDFTGVPCVVDLATMREAVAELGGDPARINPLAPAELVIDHSVVADYFGTTDAFARNVELEYERNRERYQFLRWGQTAFDEFKVVPPGTGIVHQVNIEHLARVVMVRDGKAYPDTCVGTDSHTTMVYGLGVLAWGVGVIEAESALLGQPVSMLIPRVVGFKLRGELPDGVTATDLVLTITEMLRKEKVVGKFVEFYGPGVSAGAAGQPGHDRQHEPGVRLDRGDFPDRRAETIRYLELTGRFGRADRLGRGVLQASRASGARPGRRTRLLRTLLELDLATIVPSIAGPKRPQDRIALTDAKSAFRTSLRDYVDHAGFGNAHSDGSDDGSFPASDPAAHSPGDEHAGRPSRKVPVQLLRRLVVLEPLDPRRGDHRGDHVVHQHLEPVGDDRGGAGREEGRRTRADPQAVGEDHAGAGLAGGLGLLRPGGPDPVPGQDRVQPRRIRLHHLHRQLRPAARGGQQGDQRGRPRGDRGAVRQPQLRGSDQPGRQDELPGLASAGGGLRDRRNDGPGHPRPTRSPPIPTATRCTSASSCGPRPSEIEEVLVGAVTQDMFLKRLLPTCFTGDSRWRSLPPTPTGSTFAWDPASTYVRRSRRTSTGWCRRTSRR